MPIGTDVHGEWPRCVTELHAADSLSNTHRSHELDAVEVATGAKRAFFAIAEATLTVGGCRQECDEHRREEREARRAARNGDRFPRQMVSDMFVNDRGAVNASRAFAASEHRESAIGMSRFHARDASRFPAMPSITTRFKAKLFRYPGKGGWTFAPVPVRHAPPVMHGWGRSSVVATVDGHTWKTSVWREKSGRSLLAVPKAVRGTKDDGDTVTVQLEFNA